MTEADYLIGTSTTFLVIGGGRGRRPVRHCSWAFSQYSASNTARLYHLQSGDVVCHACLPIKLFIGVGEQSICP